MNKYRITTLALLLYAQIGFAMDQDSHNLGKHLANTAAHNDAKKICLDPEDDDNFSVIEDDLDIDQNMTHANSAIKSKFQPQKCHLCPNSPHIYKCSMELDDHMKWHDGRRFRCPHPTCPDMYDYPSLYEIKRHAKNMHNVHYTSQDCRNAAVYLQSPQYAKKKINATDAPINIPALDSHINDSTKNNNQGNSGEHRCKNCSVNLSSAGALKSHIKRFTNLDDSSMFCEEAPSRCIWCKKFLPDQATITDHKEQCPFNPKKQHKTNNNDQNNNNNT